MYEALRRRGLRVLEYDPPKDKHEHDLSGVGVFCVPTKRGYADMKNALKMPFENRIILSTMHPGGMLEVGAREFDIYCPVFLRISSGVDDFMRPPKIVFGTKEPMYTPKWATDIFACSVRMTVTWAEAEWCKMMHNLFMCVKVTFANEMRQMGCPESAFDLVFNENERGRLLTMSHMQPLGPFTGTCLPKDIAWAEESYGLPAMLLACMGSNNRLLVNTVDQFIFAPGPRGVLTTEYADGSGDTRGSLFEALHPAIGSCALVNDKTYSRTQEILTTCKTVLMGAVVYDNPSRELAERVGSHPRLSKMPVVQEWLESLGYCVE